MQMAHRFFMVWGFCFWLLSCGVAFAADEKKDNLYQTSFFQSQFLLTENGTRFVVFSRCELDIYNVADGQNLATVSYAPLDNQSSCDGDKPYRFVGVHASTRLGLVAIALADASVLIIDTRELTKQYRFSALASIKAVVFSADGDKLLVATNAHWIEWDFLSGNTVTQTPILIDFTGGTDAELLAATYHQDKRIFLFKSKLIVVHENLKTTSISLLNDKHCCRYGFSSIKNDLWVLVGETLYKFDIANENLIAQKRDLFLGIFQGEQKLYLAKKGQVVDFNSQTNIFSSTATEDNLVYHIGEIKKGLLLVVGSKVLMVELLP